MHNEVRTRLESQLAERVMALAPQAPDPSDFALWEVFRHSDFINGSPEFRREVMLQSSSGRFDWEQQRGFLKTFFPERDTSRFHGASLLDLGCFTGGRSVFWKIEYGFGSVKGIDINPLFAEAGALFAKERGVEVSFSTGYGENLPYEDESFDFVFTFDVLEHVRDVERTLAEVFRVLRKRGEFLVVFPQFMHPREAHLGMYTRVPALQWIFSGQALARAIYSIGCKRGEAAAWYARSNPNLEPWEKSPYLNGTSVDEFRRIVRRQGWRIVQWDKHSFLRYNALRSRRRLLRLADRALTAAAAMPRLEELLLGGVRCVLQKPTV